MIRFLTPLPAVVNGFTNVTSTTLNGSQYFSGSAGTNLDVNLQTTPFSISVWIKPAAQSGDIFASNSAVTLNGIELFLNGSGQVRVYVGEQTVTTLGMAASTPTGLFNNGAWAHLGLTFDGSGDVSGLKFYANGSLVMNSATQNTLASSSASGSPYYIGAFRGGASLNSEVDEMSFWSAALSAGQITSIYNGGTPTNLMGASNLLSWYRFETGLTPADSATTVFDRAGSNNITGTGTPTFTADVP